MTILAELSSSSSETAIFTDKVIFCDKLLLFSFWISFNSNMLSTVNGMGSLFLSDDRKFVHFPAICVQMNSSSLYRRCVTVKDVTVNKYICKAYYCQR